jgi:superfamily I DNA/RNA helicase
MSAKENALKALKSNRTVVLGPPGTGKTTTMMSIIEELMARGVSIQDIAFLSFSRKAVREAKERAVAKFGLDAEKDLPLFRTLHSFSFKLTRSGDLMDGKQWRKFCEEYQWDVSDDGDEDEDGDNLIVSPVSKNKHDRIKQAHTWARNTLQTLDDACLKFGENRKDLMRFDLNLRAFRQENGLADYPSGMEAMIAGRVEIPCRVLIVDEAQDLSPLNQAALAPTIAKVERVIVAGDDDQAIYEFQGADQRWLISLTKRDDWSTVVLSQSYRLRKKPWEFSKRFSSAMEERAEKSYYPIDDGFHGRVVEDALFDDAIERVIETAVAPQFRGRSCAWLARRKVSLQRAQDELLKSAAPFVSQVGKVERNPLRKNKEGVCIVRSMVETLTKLRDGEQVRIADLVLVCEEGLRLKKAKKDDKECLYGQVKFKSQLNGLIKDGRRNVSRHDLMSDHCDGRKLLKGLDTVGPLAVLDKLKDQAMDYLKRIYETHGRIPEPRIHLSSIHQSKGGEWDVVVMDVSTSAGLERCLAKEDAFEAEKRIAYVAATRTRDELWVMPMVIADDDGYHGERDYLTIPLSKRARRQ